MKNLTPSALKRVKFDLSKLLALAAKLRGRPCHCDRDQPAMNGGMNWAISLTFDDGVDWIFRSPEPYTFSDDVLAKMLVSEVATMQCIKEHTSIPVPDVFSFSETKHNDIGVPYILQSKAPGRNLHDDSFAARHGRPGISDDQKHKIMLQLGVFARQLARLQFPCIGSLMPVGKGQTCQGRSRCADTAENDNHSDQGSDHSSVGSNQVSGSNNSYNDSSASSNGNFGDHRFIYDADYVVGECLAPAFEWQWRHDLEDLDRGPFYSESAYLNGLAMTLYRQAQEMAMTNHVLRAPVPERHDYATMEEYLAAIARWNDFVTLGGKTESSSNRLEYCMVAEILRDRVVPRLCDKKTEEGGAGDEVDYGSGFPLMHPDLHGGNIFVDDDMNVTCIIDWSSATTVPVAQLLSTPNFWGGNPRFAACFRTTASAALPTQANDAGRDAFWAKTDKFRLFEELARSVRTRDYDCFFELLADQITDRDELFALLMDYVVKPQNKALLAKLREEETPSDDLADDECRRFRLREKEGELNALAVARKLTLMREMNVSFVADKRLWKWLNAAIGSEQYIRKEGGQDATQIGTTENV
ncbi:Protein kinase-like domain protein [Niveomyces insectorum RCEF 264]|uniref:Protein kinase-like domain protein n=1 Tax=Niveomyces insectorum RCEF 264 TaxID=1081102 RepID=A0A167UPI5_9HYPO|nr:Protein kinase-like domain protein [Niveomyces insectorum RCEF 264]